MIAIAVTISDIAKAADVAPATVSRVIAGNPRISKATAARVKKIMEEMDYHPNMIARSLVNRSTKILGVMMNQSAQKALNHHIDHQMLSGIATCAYQNGYNILLSNAQNPEEEQRMLGDMAGSGIADAILLLSSRIGDKAVSELRTRNTPFVLIGTPSPEEADRINWVDNDNVSAGYQVTRHLIEKGHRRIALIGHSEDHVLSLQRFEGYRAALREAGLPLEKELVIESEFFYGNGYEMVKNLIESGKKFSAVLAADDFLAFEGIRYLTEHAIRVPEDIAVAGFNNVPLSSYFIPPLTSVEINAYSIGETACRLIIQYLADERRQVTHAVVPSEVMVRKSTVAL